MKSGKGSPLLVAALGTVLVSVLAVIWSRGEPVIGHDSFSYIELTKEFREHPPDHFGDWWPFGLPLLAAALTHFGLSAFAGLAAVTAAAYLGMIWCFWWALPDESKGWTTLALVVTAICAPVCPILLCMVWSEPLFSVFVFGFAIALGRWPSKRAIVAAMVMAIAAFCVRYVGAFAVGLIGLWTLLQWNSLGRTQRRGFVVVSYLVTILITGFLLYLNYRHSGSIAGPQPVGREPFSLWPQHLADFGWSPVSAFISNSVLRDVGGIRSPAGLAGGAALIAGVGWYLFRRWKSATSPATTAVILTIAGYSLAMVTLRATTRFDSLSNARTFLPVLFPLAYLVATGEVGRFRRAVMLGCGISVTASLLLAARGISPKVKPDITAARSALARVLKPGQTVAVNGEARALAAYFENRFQPPAMKKDGVTALWETLELWDARNSDFTVVVEPSKTTASAESAAEAARWADLIRRAVASGQAKIVAADNSFVLLEGLKAAPGSP
ncbi:MAG TPA: hypothetical protein VM940_03895 [Chthoniobacterales bacterium]|nr:hypothetical protein [Chthoniobacterales bacterium]